MTRASRWPSVISRATGLTVRALHHYDRRGLTSLEGEVTACQFVGLIESMITVDRKLTREQLAELHQQREQLLPADFPESGAG
ncbi:MAG TPA: hypothetical protein VFW50_30665 [Streptosporangiaceae bacterium]|nr:hypothetical protein [Streptosporangiaceae bacterium]